MVNCKTFNAQMDAPLVIVIKKRTIVVYVRYERDFSI